MLTYGFRHVSPVTLVTFLKSCMKFRKAFALFRCFLHGSLLCDLDRERDALFLSLLLQAKCESTLWKYASYCVQFVFRLSHSRVSLGLLEFAIRRGLRCQRILIVRTSFLLPCVSCYFVIFFSPTAVLHDLTIILSTHVLYRNFMCLCILTYW